jgi:hypothetical protein
MRGPADRRQCVLEKSAGDGCRCLSRPPKENAHVVAAGRQAGFPRVKRESGAKGLMAGEADGRPAFRPATIEHPDAHGDITARGEHLSGCVPRQAERLGREAINLRVLPVGNPPEVDGVLLGATSDHRVRRTPGQRDEGAAPGKSPRSRGRRDAKQLNSADAGGGKLGTAAVPGKSGDGAFMWVGPPHRFREGVPNAGDCAGRRREVFAVRSPGDMLHPTCVARQFRKHAPGFIQKLRATILAASR